MKFQDYINASRHRNDLHIDHYVPTCHLLKELEKTSAQMQHVYDNLIYIPPELNLKYQPMEVVYKGTVDPAAFYQEPYNFQHVFPPKYFDIEEFFTKIDSVVDSHTDLSSRFSEYTFHLQTGKNKRNITQINQRLRHLKTELRLKFSQQLFVEIKQLVLQLHSYMVQNLKLIRKVAKKGRKFCFQLKRDIRKYYRSKVTILFKLMNDFSGSEEEEAAFVKCGNSFFEQFKIISNASSNNYYYSNRHLYSIYRT